MNGGPLGLPVLIHPANGGEPFEYFLAFDTGASFLTLPREELIELGHDPDKAIARVRVAEATGRVEGSLVSLQRVEAVQEGLDDVIALCQDHPSDLPVDGLLGLSFLKHFDITLRFSDGFLELIPHVIEASVDVP